MLVYNLLWCASAPQELHTGNEQPVLGTFLLCCSSQRYSGALGTVKSQFLHLCSSKYLISPMKSLRENPRSPASRPAWVLQADLLVGTLRNDEIPLNSGDGKRRRAELWPERWEGCAYPWSPRCPPLLSVSPAGTAALSPLLVALPCWLNEQVKGDQLR